MSNSTQPFTFPVRKASDILQFMRDLNISVTEEELKEGNREAVRRIFEQLVDMCLGITKEELSQPVFDGLKELNYPELHEDSIPELAFFRSVTKLMRTCGIFDFKYTDLTNPDFNRLRRQLSGAINFAKFREELLVSYSDLASRSDDLMDSKQNTEEAAEIMRRKLADVKARMVTDAPEIDALEAECSRLEEDVNDKNREQAILRHEFNDIKENQVKELDDNLLTVEFKLQEAKAAQSTLRSQLVQSPQRLKQELQSSEEVLKEERVDVGDMERRLRELTASLDATRRAQNDVSSLQEQLNSVGFEMSGRDQAEADAAAQRATLAGLRADLTREDARRAELERRLGRGVERQSTLQKKVLLGESAAAQALTAAQAELEEAVEEQRCQRQRLAQAQAELEQEKSKCAREKAEQDAVCGDMHGTFKSLEACVETYHSRLLTNITNVVPN